MDDDHGALHNYVVLHTDITTTENHLQELNIGDRYQRHSFD